nr:DUF1304 family protein [Companilactobacillus halodurans]
MQILTLFIVALVAVEHVGIAFLEMFAKPDMQAKAFDMPLDFVKSEHAQIALANQGIYNGLFGVLIMLMILFFTGSTLKNYSYPYDALHRSCGPLWCLYSFKEDSLFTRIACFNRFDFGSCFL